MSLVLKINGNDSLAVALQTIPANSFIPELNITVVEDIQQKQKIVLHNIAATEPITMYGVKVGIANHNLIQGQQLRKADIQHDAETYSTANKINYNYSPPTVPGNLPETFNGYHRSNGTVGTRNFWLVIPLVFCENQNIAALQQAFEQTLGYATPNTYIQQVQSLVTAWQQGTDVTNTSTTNQAQQRVFKNIDGIKFMQHQLGCGGSRSDAKTLCNLLAGYINHANVAGATVLSLGCQNATIDWLKEALQKLNPNFDKPLVILDQQQEGSNENLLQKAIQQTFEGLVKANTTERTPAPISKLVLGLKCGGSDGFSGISANPALGHASDLVIQKGGASILAEFPELCGVEQELINRCNDTNQAQKFETLMRDYAALSESFGNPFHMNPSEGNIKDGLLTDAMKSAGAARKAGYAPIAAVLDYTEPVQQAGLHLLCTPGNDVEATTGIAASGATVTVFTTGLGTPTGNPVSPMIKLSSNTELLHKMPDVIDFDSGTIITGEQNIEENGAALLQKIISIANGETTKAEDLNQNDFIPWRKSISV